MQKGWKSSLKAGGTSKARQSAAGSMRPLIGRAVLCESNGPPNEAPMLAARGAILLASQTGPTARLTLDIALGKTAVGVDQRHTYDVGPFCERAIRTLVDARSK